MVKQIIQSLRRVLVRDRVICRLIAAWCSFAATVVFGSEDFSILSFAQEIGFGKILATVAIFFIFYTLIAAVISERPEVDSWFLLLAATVCVWFWLNAEDEPLFVLAIGVVYTLFLVWTIRQNLPLLRTWNPSRRQVAIAAALVALVSCTVIATITCLRYKTFSAPNFDFGLFCNMFYNMKETGLPMATSERDRLLSHFAVHISPVYYLFLPFFYLFPSPLTLQIGQAVVLALGVIPIVLLAQHFKLSNRITILLSALYAFYPALTTGCFYDLHENCFLPLFLLLTFLFYEKKKYLPMYLSALLVLSIKEDAAIYLLMFALFLLLSEKKYLHGAILAALSVGYFVLCGYLLETYGTGMMVNRFDNLIYQKEDGLIGAIKTALVNPGYLLTQLFTTQGNTWEKIVYVLQMFLPLGLIPFCSKKPSRWLLAAPILVNLLTYYVYQYNLNFQYHFGITAFLFYALIKNLPELQPPTRHTLLGVAAAFCLCFYLSSAVPTLSRYTGYWSNSKETYEQMEEILEAVEDDASVTASSFLVAHLADRAEIYEFQYHEYKTDTEYVVFDTRYRSCEADIALYRNAGYEIVAGRDGLAVVMRKAPVG